LPNFHFYDLENDLDTKKQAWHPRSTLILVFTLQRVDLAWMPAINTRCHKKCKIAFWLVHYFLVGVRRKTSLVSNAQRTLSSGYSRFWPPTVSRPAHLLCSNISTDFPFTSASSSRSPALFRLTRPSTPLSLPICTLHSSSFIVFI